MRKQYIQAILSKTQQLAYLSFIKYTAHISFVTAQIRKTTIYITFQLIKSFMEPMNEGNEYW